MLPKDPMILLSFVNTKLRDEYNDLTDLCTAWNVKEIDLIEKLALAGYRYDPATCQFI